MAVIGGRDHLSDGIEYDHIQTRERLPMPDLTPQLLPLLDSLRAESARASLGFAPDADLVLPAYDGGSIVNLPAALCRVLGVPPIGAPALDEAIFTALSPDSQNGVRQIVMILMDALSLQRLRRWMSDGTVPLWGQLAADGALMPLTSIVPSTTSAALTTLWTGRSAAEHGVLGYELWLKEYGVVANMINQGAFTFKGDAGGLQRAGFRPDEFLQFPRLGRHLASHGVSCYGFQRHAIVRSGLSQMLMDGVERCGFATPADLWVGVRERLESGTDERQYIWVYWDAIDTISHEHGPDSERAAAEFAQFSFAFERNFLARLSGAVRRGTLLLLAADHGQITTRPDPHYDLRNHPNLTRRLHILPTGENRLMYLYIRPGQVEAVREYFDRTWPNQFSLLEPAYAAHAGLFGPGEPHPRLADRYGDLLAVARQDAYLWWAPFDNPSVGRHGGLSPDEMFVPLLAVQI